MGKSSRIKEFYHKTYTERLRIIKEFASLSNTEIDHLKNLSALTFKAANRMVENVISTMPIPLGIATNFLINNKDYLIPMATEEPSVIAAASYGAKLARTTNGFTTTATAPIMIGQIQVVNIPNINNAINNINENKTYIIEIANKQDPILIAAGGGVHDITSRIIKTSRGTMLIIHLLVNVQDAMGANIITAMAEKITPTIEKLTKANVRLRIVSNLATHRIVTSSATWIRKDIGENTIESILDACALAQEDPFRCATHNKGVMNGIDAVVIATGNDFRAVEAGAHGFASLQNAYKPLTNYYKNKDGDLVGKIELPMAVGIIGGITQIHPTAKISLKILDVKNSCELAQVIATVGLAQNLAALKALVTEGIQRGHMKLHSKNIAISAGVQNGEVEQVAQIMVRENNISIARAKEILKQL
jgi:hydroxymethylglutaryl-CoA reductase